MRQSPFEQVRSPAVPATPAQAELYSAWGNLRTREHQPKAARRDEAAELKVSEACLVAARCAHGLGFALAPAPQPILAGIATLGRVTARTQSVAAVLENAGTYGMPDIGEHTGIVIGDTIDLRIFPADWKYAYALVEGDQTDVQRSIAIFDSDGVAAHEILLRPESHIAQFDELIESLRLIDASEPPAMARAGVAQVAADPPINIVDYRAAYASMQDTHDFFMLLRRFAITRETGLRLAEPRFARQVGVDAQRRLFIAAAAAQIPLMIFVANAGMVQISSGAIPPPSIDGFSFRVCTADFSLHLDERKIARAWAVRKPTVNGVITSLELYAADGQMVVQIFGERHEGGTERTDWAAAIATL